MFQKPSEDITTTNKEKYQEDEVETVVGPSVHVEGDFNSAGNILIKGSVAGRVSTDKLLTIEEGAKVSADIKAGDSIVSGEIIGNAKIENRLELTQTARITGDIKCNILVVHAGALVKGKIMMPGLESVEKNSAKKTSTRSRAKSKKEDSEE
ncbi:MAG: polymer-forming cytoskeletal protein [Candidatus Magasanikbacteria bacterium]|nr:polymer-forming cytoskeletal protein [Candidatus Magasanikbacteria bacterium]